MARGAPITANIDDHCARVGFLGPLAFEPKCAFTDGLPAERLAVRGTQVHSSLIPEDHVRSG
jgi:hypothetical protein